MGRKGKEAAKSSVVETEASLPKERLTTTTTPFKPDHVQDPFALVDMYVAALKDPTRVQDMVALGRELEGLPPLDELKDRRLNIFAVCGVSIRKAAANPKEARAAYRVVGLLALTLRATSSDLLGESFPLLSKMLRVQATRDDTPMLVAALECLAAVTFAGALDMKDIECSMKEIWAVIFPPVPATSSKITPQGLVAALSAWTLLACTYDTTPSKLKKDRAAWIWNKTIPSLAELLEHGDHTVRMAAGKAIVVCAEVNLTKFFPRKDMEAVTARMRDLAAQTGGPGVNNTKASEQRYLFTKIVAFMDHAQFPTKLL